MAIIDLEERLIFVWFGRSLVARCSYHSPSSATTTFSMVITIHPHGHYHHLPSSHPPPVLLQAFLRKERYTFRDWRIEPEVEVVKKRKGGAAAKAAAAGASVKKGVQVSVTVSGGPPWATVAAPWGARWRQAKPPHCQAKHPHGQAKPPHTVFPTRGCLACCRVRPAVKSRTACVPAGQ
jgi:hypothetical protein